MGQILLWLLIQHASANAPAKLNVGLSDVAPFSYKDRGQIRGLHYEILQQLAQKAGFSFKYELYPHARLSKTLNTESVELTILFAPLCEQNRRFEILASLYSLSPKIYLLLDSAPQDKSHLKIARLRGTCTDLINEFVKPENVFDVSEVDQAIAMLRANRVDGVCGLWPVLNFSIRKGKPLKISSYRRQKQPYESVLCVRRTISDRVKLKLENAARDLHFKIPDEDGN